MFLAALALALAPAQITPGPLYGPSGGALEIVDIELCGTTHWLLGTETLASGRRPVVAKIDAAGTVIWTPTLPPGVVPTNTSGSPTLMAVGENRILVKDLRYFYRTYTLTPQAWVADPPLTGQAFGSFLPRSGDISGSRVVLQTGHLPSGPVVMDLATADGPELIPTIPYRGLYSMQIDGDTVMAVEREIDMTPSGEYVVVATRIPVFRRVNGAWSRALEIEHPASQGWRGVSGLSFEGGTVAVTAPSISPQDPCPKLYVFEADSNGDFVLEAEFAAATSCATSQTTGIGYQFPRLLGSELAAVESASGRVDRFERTSQGWIRRERVAADSFISGGFWPVSGQLVGTMGQPNRGSEVFSPVDSPGYVRVACPTSAPVFSTLSAVGRSETAVGPTTMVWNVDAALPGTPYFFAVGLEPGARPLGPTAELCIGGAVSVVAPDYESSLHGKDRRSLTIDPVAAGWQPGDTLYVQGWRPDPLSPGGLTSNLLSIVFAP